MPAPLHVLALNSGSSSLKFGLYAVEPDALCCLVSGAMEAIGDAARQREAVVRIGELLSERRLPQPQAIGHRIVHGGPHLTEHCRVDSTVLDTLAAATAFAPLHTPAALAVLRYSLDHFPGLPQVACFDTRFHAQMPALASTLPLPAEWRERGIRRYGFHGLSCESIVHQLGPPLPPRLIIAHLGNGASITAVLDGVSIDTSMGMTPSGGIVMSTRTGDLDPGVLVHLLRERLVDAAGIEPMIDHRSGLLGVSGVSGDLRVLHARAPSDPDARLAIDLFCYSAAKQIAAMTTVLGGIDALVFTGGIGEHDAEVRASIVRRLACLGVELDPLANAATAPSSIGTPSSRCAVRVLPSLEDEQIARHAYALC